MGDLAVVAPKTVAALHGFASQLDGVTDPDARVPGLEWSVLDLARHVLAGARSYERMMRDDDVGWRDLFDGPSENRRIMDELVDEPTLPAIAAALRTAADALASTWAAMGGKEDVPWHGGIRLPAHTTVTFFWSDVLVHGWDLARLTHVPWPVPAADAAMMLDEVLAVAPAFVDTEAAQGFEATFAVRLRGSETYVLAFAPEATLHVTIAEPGARVAADCRMSADPSTFLLASYGRLSPVRAALTGGILAYGRKPWLAFRFDQLLRNP